MARPAGCRRAWEWAGPRAQVFDEDRPRTRSPTWPGYRGPSGDRRLWTSSSTRTGTQGRRAGAPRRVPDGRARPARQDLLAPRGSLARRTFSFPSRSHPGPASSSCSVGVGASRVRDWVDKQDRKRGTSDHLHREMTPRSSAGPAAAVVSNDGGEHDADQLWPRWTVRPRRPRRGSRGQQPCPRSSTRPAPAGRFDRQVTIPSADVGQRTAILPCTPGAGSWSPDVDSHRHRRVTPGSPVGPGQPYQRGGHLRGPPSPGYSHGRPTFDAAPARIILGRRESTNVLLAEITRVAVPESVAALWRRCPCTRPVAKVTILPAGQALG